MHILATAITCISNNQQVTSVFKSVLVGIHGSQHTSSFRQHEGYHDIEGGDETVVSPIVQPEGSSMMPLIPINTSSQTLHDSGTLMHVNSMGWKVDDRLNFAITGLTTPPPAAAMRLSLFLLCAFVSQAKASEEGGTTSQLLRQCQLVRREEQPPNLTRQYWDESLHHLSASLTICIQISAQGDSLTASGGVCLTSPMVDGWAGLESLLSSPYLGVG